MVNQQYGWIVCPACSDWLYGSGIQTSCDECFTCGYRFFGGDAQWYFSAKRQGGAPCHECGTKLSTVQVLLGACRDPYAWQGAHNDRAIIALAIHLLKSDQLADDERYPEVVRYAVKKAGKFYNGKEAVELAGKAGLV